MLLIYLILKIRPKSTSADVFLIPLILREICLVIANIKYLTLAEKQKQLNFKQIATKYLVFFETEGVRANQTDTI